MPDTTMNEELKRWIEESKPEIKKSLDEKSKSKKKLKSKCEICGEKQAKHICLQCEKAVCKSCYFKIIGVCKKCIPPEIAGKWEGSVTDWEKEFGVEWVD
jgi:hypothetical protein